MPPTKNLIIIDNRTHTRNIEYYVFLVYKYAHKQIVVSLRFRGKKQLHATASALGSLRGPSPRYFESTFTWGIGIFIKNKKRTIICIL